MYAIEEAYGRDGRCIYSASARQRLRAAVSELLGVLDCDLLGGREREEEFHAAVVLGGRALESVLERSGFGAVTVGVWSHAGSLLGDCGEPVRERGGGVEEAEQRQQTAE